jgi:phosphopantetheinyl transferase
MEDWALPGDPFQLAAVSIHAADWPALLPPESRQSLARAVDPVAQARAGASAWLKTRWLPRQLGRETVAIEAGPHGKPKLTGPDADWGFNVSHAGDWAVIGLIRGADIGVDFESLRRKVDIGVMGRRVLSPEERETLRRSGDTATGFLMLWSQKEALLKALGSGWAHGDLVRRTRLQLVAYQVEPVSGVSMWSRTVLEGAYVLSVGVRRRGRRNF